MMKNEHERIMLYRGSRLLEEWPSKDARLLQKWCSQDERDNNARSTALRRSGNNDSRRVHPVVMNDVVQPPTHATSLPAQLPRWGSTPPQHYANGYPPHQRKISGNVKPTVPPLGSSIVTVRRTVPPTRAVQPPHVPVDPFMSAIDEEETDKTRFDVSSTHGRDPVDILNPLSAPTATTTRSLPEGSVKVHPHLDDDVVVDVTRNDPPPPVELPSLRSWPPPAYAVNEIFPLGVLASSPSTPPETQ